MSLAWGREICGELPLAESREWLCTNGIGGFASGTVPGVLTRRYHGLLVAALKPPLGRTLLVTKVDERVEYAGLARSLGVNRWADGTVDPSGHADLEAFRLDGTTPVWTYACADALQPYRRPDVSHPTGALSPRSPPKRTPRRRADQSSNRASLGGKAGLRCPVRAPQSDFAQ